MKHPPKFFLFADYDGTLTPIVSHAKKARLSKKLRRLLKKLSRKPGCILGIVSGRALPELKRFVGVPGLVYIGNHGFELESSRFSFVHPSARRARPLMERIADTLEESLKEFRGAWVERKGWTVSVHWRGVSPRKQSRCRRRILVAVASARRAHKIRLTHGKCVTEIRPPVLWNKGTMIEWAVKRLAGRNRRFGSCYLGDDRTDEDAFRVVNRLGGISIFVGKDKKHSRACYSLKNPNDVQVFFKHLLDDLPVAEAVCQGGGVLLP